MVARLWSMAVTIEDGNVSDAEQALRAAEEALRQALERAVEAYDRFAEGGKVGKIVIVCGAG